MPRKNDLLYDTGGNWWAYFHEVEAAMTHYYSSLPVRLEVAIDDNFTPYKTDGWVDCDTFVLPKEYAT